MFYGSQPLVKYSQDLERASFFDDVPDSSMPRSKKSKRKGTASPKAVKGVRFIKGRIALRLSGYGVQKLAAVDLVRFIPLSKLKQAAKKVLKSKGIRRTKKSKRKSKKQASSA
jgi:hypothetical protein